MGIDEHRFRLAVLFSISYPYTPSRSLPLVSHPLLRSREAGWIADSSASTGVSCSFSAWLSASPASQVFAQDASIIGQVTDEGGGVLRA
jgi:hypothetical protein